MERSRIIFGPREHFYNCPLSKFVQPKSSFLSLDITSGKVAVGGDGSNEIPFTSRPDVARYLSYVLTHVPAEQLKNRSFNIAGDTKVRASLYRRLDGNRIIKSVVQRDIQGI